MTDFLTTLAARTLGLTSVLQPVIASMFAPGQMIASDDATTPAAMANSQSEQLAQQGDTEGIRQTQLPDLSHSPLVAQGNHAAAISRLPYSYMNAFTRELSQPVDNTSQEIVSQERQALVKTIIIENSASTNQSSASVINSQSPVQLTTTSVTNPVATLPNQINPPLQTDSQTGQTQAAILSTSEIIQTKINTATPGLPAHEITPTPVKPSLNQVVYTSENEPSSQVNSVTTATPGLPAHEITPIPVKPSLNQVVYTSENEPSSQVNSVTTATPGLPAHEITPIPVKPSLNQVVYTSENEPSSQVNSVTTATLGLPAHEITPTPVKPSLNQVVYTSENEPSSQVNSVTTATLGLPAHEITPIPVKPSLNQVVYTSENEPSSQVNNITTATLGLPAHEITPTPVKPSLNQVVYTSENELSSQVNNVTTATLGLPAHEITPTPVEPKIQPMNTSITKLVITGNIQPHIDSAISRPLNPQFPIPTVKPVAAVTQSSMYSYVDNPGKRFKDSANNESTTVVTTPTINVTIGRIEVRATKPPTTPPPTKTTQKNQSLSLQDYLKQRQGGNS
ncbi:hypothetical protein [Aetokthonos hydrillicola]|uniref:hypothetical protein n=1 Tax=Aetokthonos hydrillicola TaxID=1550245 RepID=UPI001ABBA3FD|nr:hypothetical protein [Aetokthonos hydrillicola]MBO3457558.1 hypothetical protein [Aetokthonos hydrillicola CCALA 1050]